MTTGALRNIDKRLQELPPESLRYRVLAALRRFRSSWVDLGRLLVETNEARAYEEWGYDDFTVYCARELGLKAPTVRKLMLSYRYLEEREPDRLARHERQDETQPPPEIPDYQTVGLLDRVSKSPDLEPAARARLHRLAFEGNAEETSLRKEIRQALAESDEETGSEEGMDRRRALDDIRRHCRLLRRKLAESRVVPQGLCERFERLLNEIEALE
jgi:hypothetical protein